MNKFGIHIKVKNIQKSYAFYKALGFKAVFAYGSMEWQDLIKQDYPGTPTANENYEGVTFEFNDGLLEIANGHVAVKPETFKESIASSKVSCMLDSDSVDEVVEICRKNDFEIAVGPRDFPWGTREVVLRDPDGFIIVFRERNYKI